MAWLAVNENGQEIISPNRPDRWGFGLDVWRNEEYIGTMDDDDMIGVERSIPLPKGSIFKLLGKNMNWDDEPIELI